MPKKHELTPEEIEELREIYSGYLHQSHIDYKDMIFTHKHRFTTFLGYLSDILSKDYCAGLSHKIHKGRINLEANLVGNFQCSGLKLMVCKDEDKYDPNSLFSKMMDNLIHQPNFGLTEGQDLEEEESKTTYTLKVPFKERIDLEIYNLIIANKIMPKDYHYTTTLFLKDVPGSDRSKLLRLKSQVPWLEVQINY